MRVIRIGLLGVLVTVAWGCGSEQPEATVDVTALLGSSAAAMVEVESASFEMRRTGAEVTVSGMVFDGAVGEYAAPDSARALLRVRAGDLAAELGTISIADRTWLTNPLTGRWEELEPGTGFNPAMIFDAEIGWRPLLTDDLSDAEYLGRSGGAHRVRGTVAGDRIAVLTAGIAAARPVVVDMEIDSDTGRLRRLHFDTEGDAGTSSWVIELSGYGEPVAIDPPAAG